MTQVNVLLSARDPCHLVMRAHQSLVTDQSGLAAPTKPDGGAPAVALYVRLLFDAEMLLQMQVPLARPRPGAS